MNAPGTYPPAPPETTARACQSEVLRLSGDLLAVAGKPHPDLDEVEGAFAVLTHAMRRWRSSHNLIHAAQRKMKAAS